MSQQINRNDLFNRWAASYDQSIQGDSDNFPFDGYNRILDEIARQSGATEGMRVLDVGIGTGNLAIHFLALKCLISGVDFSSEMLSRAGEKLPDAQLVQMNLEQEAWSTKLPDHFDCIVSSYVLHEFDASRKMQLLQTWMQHLSGGGRIVIGDIAFSNAKALEMAYQRWAKYWDNDEHYWVAEDSLLVLKQMGFDAQYIQVSSCGGVFSMAVKM